ncbi:hypothetical protein [Terrihabitans sp. B22-R8]|uniref:hypothetical protein n=1 Tax=Terrihabitans sp. B22-R8 TaxID=3425128 RepID=UPI00403C5F05
MAYLVQILLPLYDRDGGAIPASRFDRVKDELTARFGGLTAFTRAPAEGRWKNEADSVAHDDIVVFEVVVPELDRAWWRNYRLGLERDFQQDEIAMRTHEVEPL